MNKDDFYKQLDDLINRVNKLERFASKTISADEINEATAGNGVTIDGLKIKDNEIHFDETSGTLYSIKHNLTDGALEIRSDNLVRFIESDSETNKVEVALNSVSGNIVTDSATQTLTNKTLTSPTVNGGTISNAILTSPDLDPSTQFTAQDSTNEGGQVYWNGAGTYASWYQDIYQTQMRIFPATTGTQTLQCWNNGSGTLNMYMEGNVSADSFTDRTPFYNGDAISEIKKIKGKKGEIDHSTLPKFAQKEVKEIKKNGTKHPDEVETTGRDLGAMISILTKAVQQLTDRIEKLEKKV